LITRVTDMERHGGLPGPTCTLLFEEVAEEAFLQSLAIVGVEVREVRTAVHFEPLLCGSGPQPAFKVAARMQTHAAPVAGGQQRRFDFLKFSGASCVII